MRGPLARATAALVVAAVAVSLASCAPSSDGAEPTPTARVVSVEVSATAEFTAAKEQGLATRDDALALLTATDSTVEGAVRSTLLSAVAALNSALGGVSAEAIVEATTATTEAELALADRVRGLGEAALATGRGSSARRAALTAAIDRLEAAVEARAGLSGAAQEVLDARDPLIPPPGSGGGPPAPQAPQQPAPATTAPAPTVPPEPVEPPPAPAPAPPPATDAPAPTAAPTQPAPEPEPEPEPTAVPVPDCSTDPDLCVPAPTPSIDDPVT
ncbi:hypothetical protein Q0F99_05720 [Rathayibacter oskolensis]|uniref:hypothetical protein n=1 Tax=Rathayibacter TaxID=33886 RepID=UPI001316D320|nr:MULTISPECIES: hypothetical protein [Rathayibacter]QHC67979.1 hypothetical protein GSU68_16335 [Rathayibacter sp. VKM Ac-2759]WKK72448.1 hypothetical protein Q0F99_05720 [Rathayibacter oskolensis]